LLVLWLVPFLRAFRFFGYCFDVYGGEQSTDAWDDYVLSLRLLASYACSFAVGAILVWLFCRKPSRCLALPLFWSFLVAFFVILHQPEEVIVLFPRMEPFLPAKLSLIGSAAAILISCGPSWLALRSRTPSPPR
jgi:hypothetical protein